MDLIGAFVGEIATIIAYVLMGLGVYKLFQVATDIHEIRELLQVRVRSAPPSPALSAELAPLADLSSSDDATAYAERLLRAVNAESHPPVPVASPDTQETR